MTEPTKGPYRVGVVTRDYELSRWFVPIYTLAGYKVGRGEGDTQEEALTAAQLLAAAWEMREVVRETKFNPCPAGTCRPDCEHCGRLNRALAALAKADGKETKNEHAK